MHANTKLFSAMFAIILSLSVAFAEDNTLNTGTQTTATAADGSGSATMPAGTSSTAPLPVEPIKTDASVAPTATTTQQPIPQPVEKPQYTAPSDVSGSGTSATCPPIAQIYCEFGNQIDEKGCKTSICNPQPNTVPPKPMPSEIQPIPSPQPVSESTQYQAIPPNCKRVVMDGGIERVICEAQPAPCPVTYTDYDIQKCKSNSGIPNFFPDARGCKVFECRFQQQEQQAFMQPAACPSEDERQRVSEKCKASGMNAIIRKDFNGCMFVDCVREERLEAKAVCPPQEDVERKANECNKMGGKVMPEFDSNGCKLVRCETGESRIFEVQSSEARESQPACKPIPQEAFEKCGKDGGNLVVKKDERGCSTFAECVMRGNERQVKYEEVKEVPDATTLIAMAFKLENLKIEFDKLAIKTENIAKYYDGSAEKQADAERFRKVSSMFLAAEKRVDEIKAKLRDRVNAPTIEDISGIKHDITYIREVVMKDILYVMLGGEEGNAPSASGASAESVKFTKNSAGEIECGSDTSCFNERMRVCDKTVFYPESGTKEKVEIRVAGLEDKRCVMKANVADKNTGNIIADMVCKFPDYVMGFKGSNDIKPYCEGTMVEYILKEKATGERQYPSEKPAMKEPVQHPVETISVPEDERRASLAKCLASKGAIMYGADLCQYCQRQKNDFGESFTLINYVKCTQKEAICKDAGITGYPTWAINGAQYAGWQSMESLAKISGCVY